MNKLETTIFDIHELSANQAIDISNWINSIPGVNDVSVDLSGSKVTVVYDPATTDRGTIKSSATSVGYLLQ